MWPVANELYLIAILLKQVAAILFWHLPPRSHFRFSRPHLLKHLPPVLVCHILSWPAFLFTFTFDSKAFWPQNTSWNARTSVSFPLIPAVERDEIFYICNEFIVKIFDEKILEKPLLFWPYIQNKYHNKTTIEALIPFKCSDVRSDWEHRVIPHTNQ